MSYRVQMERGPEEEKADLGPLPVIPELLMTDGERYAYYAARHKAGKATRDQDAANKAAALDDAKCQIELANSGRSILACEFIKDSAKVQGVTLREFLNREIP